MGVRHQVLAIVCTCACRVNFDRIDALDCTGGSRSVIAMGHCYTLHELGTNILWTDAKAACEAGGGHLVTYATLEEEMAVIPVLAPMERAWIGMTDIEVETNWVWITGEPFVHMNWRGVEPNNGGGGSPENCGAHSDMTTSWQWNDLDCNGGLNTTLNYICETDG